MLKKLATIELDMDELKDLLQRAEAKQFNDEDYETIKAVVESYAHVANLVGNKSITIARLRKMLFGASTEKTAAVIGSGTDSEAPPLHDENAATDSPADSETASKHDPPAPSKGHGRNGADAYRGAEKIQVPHESLRPGDACPDCMQGTVYEVSRPGVLVRLTGQAPLLAKIYDLQKLRCNPCGKVFTAKPPEGVGNQKYDATAGSMIALLKYGTGMPFNRFEGLQGNLGIPLPASTQWDIVRAHAKRIEPAHGELVRQAGQGDLLHNDDTPIKILELMGKRAKQRALAEGSVEGVAQKKVSFRQACKISGRIVAVARWRGGGGGEGADRRP